MTQCLRVAKKLFDAFDLWAQEDNVKRGTYIRHQSFGIHVQLRKIYTSTQIAVTSGETCGGVQYVLPTNWSKVMFAQSASRRDTCVGMLRHMYGDVES